MAGDADEERIQKNSSSTWKTPAGDTGGGTHAENKKAVSDCALTAFEILVGCEWLEHSTYGLRVRCSTN